MAIRSFSTPDGVRWDVWEVRPQAAPGAFPERRTRDRRGQDLLLYTGPERRKRDRRAASPAAPARTKPELANGWLVFESKSERRRLSPPPQRWESLPAPFLADLLHRARVVPKLVR